MLAWDILAHLPRIRGYKRDAGNDTVGRLDRMQPLSFESPPKSTAVVAVKLKIIKILIYYHKQNLVAAEKHQTWKIVE